MAPAPSGRAALEGTNFTEDPGRRPRGPSPPAEGTTRCPTEGCGLPPPTLTRQPCTACRHALPAVTTTHLTRSPRPLAFQGPPPRKGPWAPPWSVQACHSEDELMMEQVPQASWEGSGAGLWGGCPPPGARFPTPDRNLRRERTLRQAASVTGPCLPLAAVPERRA